MAERKVRHRYARVSRRMESDERVRRLSRPAPCGLSLWRWLLTCRQGGSLPGVICIGKATMAEANAWTVEQLSEPLAELLRERLIEIDDNACLVWLPNALKHDAPANGNTVIGWSTRWDEVPECALKTRIYGALRDHMIERDAEDEAKASKAGKHKKTDWLTTFEQACGTPSENRFGMHGDTVAETVPDTVSETVPSRARARLTGTGTITGSGSPTSIDVGGAGGDKPPPAAKRPSPSKKTAMPDDWLPDTTLRDQCHHHDNGEHTDSTIDAQAVKFRNWAIANNKRHTDRGRRAAFRNWLIRHREDHPSLPRYRPPPPEPSPLEVAAEERERRAMLAEGAEGLPPIPDDLTGPQQMALVRAAGRGEDLQPLIDKFQAANATTSGTP